MGNCLVTKLKEEVLNDNLPLFGNILISTPASDTLYHIRVEAYVNTTLTLEGNGYFTNSSGTENYGKTSSTAATVDIYVKATGDCKVYCDARYDINRLTVTNEAAVNSDELIWSRPIDLLSISHMVGANKKLGSVANRILDIIWRDADTDVSELLYEFITSPGNTSDAMKEITFRGEFKPVDLAIFANARKLHVNIFARCYGDFKYLAYTMKDGTHTGHFKSTSQSAQMVSGSIEEFVQIAQSDAVGRTTGSFVLAFAKTFTNITYQGVKLSENTNVPAPNDNNTFTWDAQGNVTWS